jgi:hypothetical protein
MISFKVIFYVGVCADQHSIHERIEKIPYGSKFQAQKSDCLLVQSGIFIRSIVVASIWRNHDLIKFSFHVVEVSSINWDTICGGSTIKGTTGLNMLSQGSQLCVHIWVDRPLPIRLTKIWAKISMPWKMDRQIWDGWAPRSTSKIVPFGKYDRLEYAGTKRRRILQQSPWLACR